ncbi:uncharacterized protein EDB91DRAFT_574012 [Suillus paluster]|uniref:uncharacterized protein n=1 Tax=Suillus paluster TaxID=48578 RepID=UPI001B8721D0|nr:uncharacterized protein EDB91DRAFT_574012 [Suillus paluster]KAG1734867.1 hypothetical protein EDB91DRAFT_574012 [Suillus paluster]
METSTNACSLYKPLSIRLLVLRLILKLTQTPLQTQTHSCVQSYPMNEDNPPSDPHMPERGRRAAKQEPSSHPPAPTGSRKGFFRDFWGKVTNQCRCAKNTARSPSPPPVGAIIPSGRTFNPAPARQVEPPNPTVVNERIKDVTKGITGIDPVLAMAKSAALGTNNVQSVLDGIDTWAAILGPLKAFNSVADHIADIHPYLKGAMSILTCASKMILDQADRDTAVYRLHLKVSEVYALMTEKTELADIESMQAVYFKIAHQTLECADFIVHYSETKSFWKRLRKHVANETTATIETYSQVFDDLMQQFRDRVTRDTAIILHRTGKDWPQVHSAPSDVR